MATLLGKYFSTDENVVAKADVQLLEKTVESLVIEFDQEKFEEFLFSGSASPKAMRPQSLFGDSLSNLFGDYS